MLLSIKRIDVPPGQRVLLRDVTWQELETILDELGELDSTSVALLFSQKMQWLPEVTQIEDRNDN